MGKLIGTARAEVALSADILDYYATHAEAFLNPRAIHGSPGVVHSEEETIKLANAPPSVSAHPSLQRMWSAVGG